MSFVDFAALKERVSIEQGLSLLGATLRKTGEQLRGCCPIHGGTNPREFVVTPAKGLWYCFAGCGGGDLIALIAKAKKIPPKEAGKLIADHFGNSTVTPTGNSTSTGKGTVPKAGVEGQERVREPLRPLDYLQPLHEGVQALGVSEEAAKRFGAGYAPRGIMRGRFAIPLHDRQGTLIAYCGRATKGESPTLIFPNGFNPESVIFNAQQVLPGPLYLVRDPLQVLTAYESGIENVVAFLTEAISAQQLEQLSSLMDEVKCDSVELF